MGYFIIVGLLVIIGVLGIFGGGVAKADAAKNGNSTSSAGLIGWGVFGVAVLLIVVLTLFKSVSTVDPGKIGLKKSFGAYHGTTGNGIVPHNPWTSVISISVQDNLRTYILDGNGTNGAAGSRDNQPVYLTVQVSWRVDRVRAVDLYTNTGGNYVERYLDPAVFEHTKAILARYAATEVLANRETIRRQVEEAINEETSKRGITIRNVTLKDIHFTQELTQAIEQTVQAKQQALREEARVRITKAEAQQKIAQAQGEAESTLIQARADANAQRLKQRTLTPLLVQMAAIDKLNKNVSVIVCSQGTNCIPQAVLSTVGK